MPAMENRIKDIVKGSADARPNLDATEAEAHMAAKGTPMIQNRSGWGFEFFISTSVPLKSKDIVKQ
jgi:hypothetical protein